MLNKRRMLAANPLTAVPGCKVLLDARYRQSVVISRTTNIPCGEGDLVDQWKDLSGNGNHYSAPTSGDRPTLSLTSANNCNNRPCILFNNKRLYSPVSTTLAALPVTVCFVASVLSGYPTDGQTGGSTRVLWTTNLADAAIYAGSANVTVNLDYGGHDTDCSFFLGTFNGANSLVRVQRNENTGDPGSNAENTGLTIGDFSTDGAPYTGYMGFYAVWNRELTLSERDFLYHYCTQAFGININK